VGIVVASLVAGLVGATIMYLATSPVPGQAEQSELALDEA